MCLCHMQFVGHSRPLAQRINNYMLMMWKDLQLANGTDLCFNLKCKNIV